MRARTLAVAAAVLLTLVTGAQLGYSTVGQPVGAQWTEPTSLASLQAGDARGVVEVAAAGGEEGGAVAWLTRRGDRYAVSVASVTARDGAVSVGPTRTVASGTRELQGLDVAVAGGEVALVWERSLGNDVVLHRGGDARVVSDDPLRVAEPSVALVDGGAVVGWQERAGAGFVVRLAGVGDGAVAYRTLEATTGGTGSPALVATRDGFAVTWFDAGSRTTRTAFGRLAPEGPRVGPTVALGEARPSGGFGGGSGPVAVDAAADGDGVRAVWLDVAAVKTGRGTPAGVAGDPATLGGGDRPRVAATDGRWLAAWVVTGRTADTDLAFAAPDGSGVLSRFPSSANHPSPLFAPHGAVAWSERGAQSRVLVSGFRDDGTPQVLARLRTEPGRLAFVGLAAAVVAVVTLPIMPWVFFSMLAAFYLTNRFFRDRTVALLARLAGVAGRDADESTVRDRLESVPPVAWAGAYVVGEVALLVYLLPSVGASVPLTFAGPVALSAGAAAGTLVLQAVEPQRSPWRIAAVFAYLQTAALWATALPTVL